MPATVPRDVVVALVEAGLLAPSGDNCQPWRFRWDGSALRIIFIPGRAESLYDFRSAASWVALGAALTNMSLAAGGRGFSLTVDLFPAGEAPDVVARTRLGPAPVSEDPLGEAMAARCVNRRPYRQEPVPAAVRDEMIALAHQGGATRLTWLDSEPGLSRAVALAAVNDRLLIENRALHDGLYRWIRWTRDEVAHRRDGMPVESLEIAAWERPGVRLLASWAVARIAVALGAGRGFPSRARGIYRRSGAIALLSTSGDRPEDYVGGGEVLQRIWLTATRRGLAFQPITGITFLLLRLRRAGGEGLSAAHRRLLEQVDREFRQVFEGAGETPIMLFRLGVAPPPSGRAPRLPADRVLTFEPVA
jgi:nitroreductase